MNYLRFTVSIASFALFGTGGGPGDGDGVSAGGSSVGGVGDGLSCCGYGMLMAANNTKTLIIKIITIEFLIFIYFFFRKKYF